MPSRWIDSVSSHMHVQCPMMPDSNFDFIILIPNPGVLQMFCSGSNSNSNSGQKWNHSGIDSDSRMHHWTVRLAYN